MCVHLCMYIYLYIDLSIYLFVYFCLYLHIDKYKVSVHMLLLFIIITYKMCLRTKRRLRPILQLEAGWGRLARCVARRADWVQGYPQHLLRWVARDV